VIPAEGTSAYRAAGGSPARYTTGPDTPGRDTTGHDTPGRDTPGRDTTGHDTPGRDTPGRDTTGRDASGRDLAGLVFVAEMYGVQLDHLAALLGVGEPRARAIAAGWRARRYAESARLGPGPPWTWLTRTGLAACGLPYTPAPPALARLAHIRAVVAVRLALEAATRYAAAGGYWRSERRLRARMGGRVGLREHVPDGEAHWPDDAPVAWAGECWAIEAELTRKTASRTAAIMRELLTRTGDYGCPAAEVRVPGRPPRHARVIYLCAPAARATVARARDTLGSAGARVEIRSLPPDAAMAPLPRPRGSPARPPALP
jgi:hypothetical protein